MNFLSLEYFLTVVNERGFTAAANRLFVSQQSLSEHIKKLENEIGTPLIIRKRPLELTPAGQIFAEAAQNILTIKANMLRDIASSLNQEERRLTLAVSTYEAPPALPELLAYFAAQYPSIEVNVVKRPDSTIASNMDGINFYFSIPPLNEQLEHVLFIRNDYRCLVLRQSLLQKVYGDRWTAVAEELRSTGDLHVVKELPFIALKDFAGTTTRFFTDTIEEFGFKPSIRFQSDNGELNSAFCLRGDGARIGLFFPMYSRFKSELDTGSNPMLLFPLRTKRDSCPLALSYRKGHTLNTVESCFLKAAREYLTKYNAENMTDLKYSVDHLPPHIFF